MQFAGVEPLSLIDYPLHVASVVFTQGCNFRCPYCHNASMIPRTLGDITEKAVLSFIQERMDFIDGVVITGGEPTLHDDLPNFIKAVKAFSPFNPLKIKLDTNGSNPQVLEQLLTAELVDYVAMDLKGSEQVYKDQLMGKDVSFVSVAESFLLLREWCSDTLHCEFRYTLDERTYSVGAAHAVLQYMVGVNYPLYLQNGRYPAYPVSESKVLAFRDRAEDLGIDVRLRYNSP